MSALFAVIPLHADGIQQSGRNQMNYHKIVTLKDGRTCTIRNGTAEDGQALLDIFNLTHAQTDYLLTYPEESTHTAQQEAEYLEKKTESADEIELLAELDGEVVGSAGIGCVARKEKTGTVRSLASAWIRCTGVSGSVGL